MASPLFGEFMGTLVLILLGDGVVAGTLLKRSKGEGAGWMPITTGWAFAVMAGVFTAIACGSRDAHLNPAVTLGFAVASGSFYKVAPYALAQISGACVGAAIVWLHFYPHWKETEDPELKRACFCRAPRSATSPPTSSAKLLGLSSSCSSSGRFFHERSRETVRLLVWGPDRGLISWGLWCGVSDFR